MQSEASFVGVRKRTEIVILKVTPITWLRCLSIFWSRFHNCNIMVLLNMLAFTAETCEMFSGLDVMSLEAHDMMCTVPLPGCFRRLCRCRRRHRSDKKKNTLMLLLTLAISIRLQPANCVELRLLTTLILVIWHGSFVFIDFYLLCIINILWEVRCFGWISIIRFFCVEMYVEKIKLWLTLLQIFSKLFINFYQLKNNRLYFRNHYSILHR